MPHADVVGYPQKRHHSCRKINYLIAQRTWMALNDPNYWSYQDANGGTRYPWMVSHRGRDETDPHGRQRVADGTANVR